MSWPDVRAALKTYLRADDALAALVGNRVFYGVPKRGAAFPLVTLAGQVGGGRDPGEAPLDRPLQQLNILGGDLASVMAVESAVRDALDQIRGATTAGEAVLYGVEVVGAVDAPDPADDRPRRVLTLDVTSRAA